MADVPEDGGVEAAVECALSHLVLHNMDLNRSVAEGAQSS